MKFGYLNKLFIRSSSKRFAPIFRAFSSSAGSANLDWKNMRLDYMQTNGHMQFTYRNGCWDYHPSTYTSNFVADPMLKMHVMANVFHYGQALFEGLKAYHCKDGKIRIFNDARGFARMVHGANRLHMEPPTWDMFRHALDEAVRRNVHYVPPYGSGGSLYIRPILFGSGPRLGLGPSGEFTFIVLVNPVGSYYFALGGNLSPVKALLVDDFDRVSPLGVGDTKAAGNYAADLDSAITANKRGYHICLYLDARNKHYVEEFNTSNFLAVRKDGMLVTSNSYRNVLNSTTMHCIECLGNEPSIQKELGVVGFERRDVPFVSEETDAWAEIGAVGTAVVVTPISTISRDDKSIGTSLGHQPPSTYPYTKGCCKQTSFTSASVVWTSSVYDYSKFPENGSVLQRIYNKLRAIHVGDDPDLFNWTREIKL